MLASDDIMKVLTEPTVDMAVTARILGLSIGAAQRARKIGDIPSFRVGRQYRVPTSKLRAMLGLPLHPPSSSMPDAA